jgi:hypothetical protein
MKKHSQQTRILILAALVLFIVSLFPTKSTVLQVDLKVTDVAGNPVEGAIAKQEWRDLIVEEQDHVEYMTSDSNGRIRFPLRSVRFPFIFRIGIAVGRLLTQTIHASLGVHASLTVRDKSDDHVWAWAGYATSGNTWPEELQLTRHEFAVDP